MSTSGSFLTSDSGQGGGNFYGRTIFSWSRTDWGRSGNVGYHNVSYNLKTYGGSPSYWQMFFNGSMNVDGTGYGFPSSIKAYGAGATNLSGTYAKTMYTDTAGNRSFGASAQGGIYTAAINTAGSGAWALANIPMYGGISSVSPNSGITDETGTISVGWSKYTGRATLYFRLDQINDADTTYRIRNVTSNPYSWVGWATWVRQTMVNTNSTTLYIYYGDDLDSNGSEDHYNSPVTRPITIANELGQANPTFNDFDYEDTNSATVAITGSNQILIQGKSTLRVTVDASDAATTNKNANRATYSFSIGGYSNSAPWPASGNVVHNVGTVSDVFGTQNLSVQAIDSRSNSKKVTKSVNVVPYSSPAFVPDLKVRYSNDFDVTDGITVEASSSKIASVSPMTISSVDKNSVNGTSGVRFDLSKGNNSSYSGSWTNIATSFGAGTGDITATLATVASSITTKMNGMTADNTVKWYVKFEITDALETTYYETVIDIGKPIFRIGTDGNVYNNEVRILNLDDAVTSRTHDMQIQADNSGGAAFSTNEGPDIAFTGTPTGYARGWGRVPKDWVPGTDIAIKLITRSSNANTSESTIVYVGCHGSGDAFTWWNILANSPGTQSWSANVVTEITICTVDESNIVAGDYLVFAWRPTTALTGTVYVVGAYMEYTSTI